MKDFLKNIIVLGLFVTIFIVSALIYKPSVSNSQGQKIYAQKVISETNAVGKNKIYRSSFAENESSASTRATDAVTQTKRASAPKRPNATRPKGQLVTVSRDVVASTCMDILRAAEARNHTLVQEKFQTLVNYGIIKYCPPRILTKKTPQCPPIKIEVNGRVMSGSLCASMCYVYQGQQYDVGYCK